MKYFLDLDRSQAPSFDSSWTRDDTDFITPIIIVYESERSDKIATSIPLSDFSPIFREMVDMNLFEKVFFDREGLITAISHRRTYFVPLIANRNQKPQINMHWHKW